jgi:FkbM family methyltransferase
MASKPPLNRISMTFGLSEKNGLCPEPQKIIAQRGFKLIYLQRRVRKFASRVRKFASIMAWTSAIKLTLNERHPALMVAYLSTLSRSFWFRTGTSDVQCLEKVFIENEYAIPYNVSPKTIIDGGANIGASALYFANRYPEAKIYAIEPESSNFEMLRRNCAGLDNIIPIQAALWHERTELNLVDTLSEKWAFAVVPGNDPQRMVIALTMDDLLDQYGITRVDILKLDVEGAEIELFSSGDRQWLKVVDIIAIELHDRFRPGCSRSFYSALLGRQFTQEICGENIMIRLLS